MKNEDFAHLHVHNEYSFLDGFGTAEAYAKRCRELGFKHIALTNHGNIDGCIRWQKKMSDKLEEGEEKIHAISGCEGYIVPDLYVKNKGEHRYHINLLVQNDTGWQNLKKILTVANLDGFYYNPRIDPTLLREHGEGLIIGSACVNTWLAMPGADSLLRDLIEMGRTVFLEVMPHDFGPQREVNEYKIKMAKEWGLPLCATNDCHYPLAKHAYTHEVILAMGQKKKWRDKDRWRYDMDTLYLTSADEMIELFRKQGVVRGKWLDEAMEMPLLIAQLCEHHIEKMPVLLPKVDIPKYRELDEHDQLIQLTLDGFEWRKKIHPWIAEKEDVYMDRIDEEIGRIVSLGFSQYFLIVHELIDWCRENDIMVGPGRGSSGGSLVAFCLGITQVDPLRYDLVFSRFISEARIDLPDIDMDFEDRKRGKILEHLKELYGEYNVIGLSTFAKSKGKGALRDVSRVFDVPNTEVNKAAACVITRSGGDARADFSLKDAFETFEDGKAFMEKYGDVAKQAMEIEGTVRGCGKHAAAMCVAADDLREGINTYYARRNSKDEPVANWDKEDGEFMGLMKLDVLGLNSLTILSEAKRLIKENKGVEVDFETLELEDERVLAEFSTGRCIGVFQFGGSSMMRYCREIGIESFEDVVAMNALHRPGTLRSGLVDKYMKRKHGIEPIPEQHPIIADITKNTQGIILYQEQIMRLLFELGGMPWRTTDTVRKVVSKSKGEEAFMKFKDQFVEGGLKRTNLPAEELAAIFTELKEFGCLEGNTIIQRASSNQHSGTGIKIKDLYQLYKRGWDQHRHRQGLAPYMILSECADGMVRPRPVKRVMYKGKQEVFALKTVSGKWIKATMGHHFLTPQGWTTLEDISPGDLVKVCPLQKPSRRVCGPGSGTHGAKSPNQRSGGQSVDREKRREKLITKYKGACQLCGSKKYVEMHHINGDDKDHSDDNTSLLCNRCHKATRDDKSFKRFRIGYYTSWEEVEEVSAIGIRHTYDIEMDGEPANYIGDNFVVHNSYSFNKSHAVEYSLISYWMMYLKIYYPAEFFVAILSYGSSDETKKELYIQEARRLGLDIVLPDINRSDAVEWRVGRDGKRLLIPLAEIKGVGEKAAHNIVAEREKNGPFESLADLESRIPPKKCNKAVKELLEETQCFEDEECKLALPEDRIEELAELFKFNLSNDPMYKYRKMLARVERFVKPTLITDLETDGQYVFGWVEKITFQIKTEGDKVGYSGCYGHIRDESGSSIMMNFERELYSRKKNELEHAEGKYVLVRVSTARKDRISVDEIWFGEEMMEGKLGELGVALATVVDDDHIIATVEAERLGEVGHLLSSCKACDLIQECSSPVYPSIGQFNIMISGEAPGKDEDRAGEGFVGRSGDLLWNGRGGEFHCIGLEEMGLERSMVYVTNAVKCWPSETKTPKPKHIKTCMERWFMREVEAVQPVVILSFGNTGLNMFKGLKSGIMEWSGKTEWSDEYNCWLCFALHPSAVLYHAENNEVYNRGILNFSETVLKTCFGA